jgi:hypothetical protein
VQHGGGAWPLLIGPIFAAFWLYRWWQPTKTRATVAPPAPEEVPDWQRAASSAARMAVTAVMVLFFGGTLCVAAIAGGHGEIPVILLALGYWLRRRWTRAQVAPLMQTTSPAGMPSGFRPAVSGAAQPTSPVMRLGKAYLRGFLAYITTLLLLTAIAQGVTPQGGLWVRINTFLPTVYLALVILPALSPAIQFLIRATKFLGMRRGFADAFVGGALGGVYLIFDLVALANGGHPNLTFGLLQVCAGAAGGFEFWRGVGSPGASRRTASLLARFKGGFMRGLRLAG